MRVDGDGHIVSQQETLGTFLFAADISSCGAAPQWLFTENESNPKYVHDPTLVSKYSKDAFHEYVVNGKKEAVNPKRAGTKVAAHYVTTIEAGGNVVLRLRLWAEDEPPAQVFGKPFDFTLQQRKAEADAFYAQKLPKNLPGDAQQTMRQAYAGLLWTKQFYNYSVYDWLKGDANMSPPPPHRKQIRNGDWPHLYNRDIISMPDKWEYPLVRRMGFGVSHDPAGPRGYRIRQGPADSVSARMVHAPQWADSGVRMEFQ